MDFSHCLNMFEEEELSLLIVKGDEVLFKSTGHGIRPLLEAIEEMRLPKLGDSLVFDKAVGKAAALLICYLEAGEVYAKTMSEPAVKFLERWGMRFTAESAVKIIKGNKTGERCPFESLAAKIDDPQEGYRRLVSLAQSMLDY